VSTARPTPARTRAPGRARARTLAGRLALAALLLAGVAASAPSGLGVFWFVPYAGVGAVLVVRGRGTSIGWLLIGIGWSLGVATASVDATAAQFSAGTLDPATALLAEVTSAAGAAAFLLFAVLAVVFPSGRLPGGRWARPAGLALGVGAVLLAATLVMPVIRVNLQGGSSSVPIRNPAALLPDLPVWQVITPETAILPIVVLLVSAVLSLLVRFRRASGIERQQLRWITAALAFVVAAVVGGLLVERLVPGSAESGVAWLGAIAAFPAVAVAIGVAVLRYRLYEIDRIISRTIGWAVVTGVLAGAFALLVLGLTAALQSLTGGGTLAVAASTLAAAALFQPLRRRVQSAVDRRFNRARYDAERTVADFGSRLRDEVELGQLRADICAAVARTAQPASLSLWLRE
jgi:hypothetical protein